MRRHLRIAINTTVVLIVLSMALAALLPVGANAGGYGNVTVSGTGTTSAGGTVSVNDSGTHQSNVGAAQSIGVFTGQTGVSSCGKAPINASGAGSAAVGQSSGNGAATPGSATGGTVVGRTAIGGDAVGGNATGANAVGASGTGGSGSGQAPSSSAVGGSAIGGSAVGGSAIGSAPSICSTTSAPPGSGTLTSESGDRTLICGTVLSYAGTVLTISTLTAQVDINIPAGVRIIGTLPKDGNACLVLTGTGGQIASIQVLQCHGSTSGMVKLPAIAASALPVGGTECGQQSLHSNTETSSSGATPSTVMISIDCPDPCSPGAPVSPGQGSSPLPKPTPTPQVSPGLPIVLPSGSSQTDVIAEVALQLKDLPTGFKQTGATGLDDSQVARSWHTTPAVIQASGHLAAFESTFRRTSNPQDLAIADRVDIYRSGSAAHLWFMATARKRPASQGRHVRALKQAGTGNESVESIVTTGQTSTVSLIFRRGRYLATITLKGLPSLATEQRANDLALVLDSRLRRTH